MLPFRWYRLVKNTKLLSTRPYLTACIMEAPGSILMIEGFRGSLEANAWIMLHISLDLILPNSYPITVHDHLVIHFDVI
jgi:hypothetical protein